MTDNASVLLVRTRTERGTLLAELSGRLSAGPGVASFKSGLFPAVERGANRVVVDLSDVPYADSTGIEALVSLYQKTQDLGGGMRILKPSPRIAELFRLTRLSEIFTIVDDEQSAIDSFLGTT